jgi:hypothetical protein
MSGPIDRRVSMRGAVVTLLTTAMLLPAPAALAAGGKGSGCPRRQPCSPAPDTTGPVVSISAPASGAAVSGTVTVSGTAADNTAVAKVEVAVDGGVFQPVSGTGNWSHPLDTTTYAGGGHTITARATDTSGNMATTSVTVTVSNVVADTTVPTLSITAPVAEGVVSGTVTVAGTAADDMAVARVEVAVDGGAFRAASGTDSWSSSFDTTAHADGAHTITARATDTSGNTATTSISVTVDNSTGASDVVVTDPAATHDLLPVGRTRLAQWDDITVVPYVELFTNRTAAFFRDITTGGAVAITLPSDSLAGWSNTANVMTSPSDLWIFGGSGPLVLRHYRLQGTPLPSSATLVETRTFGNGDSRVGDLVGLASGGLVAAWHQQGGSGQPQGQYVAYRSAAGGWTQLPALTFMPTRASDQVLAQHPADGSVWLFSNPDAWGAIGAVHFTELAGSVVVDWTDGFFLDDTEVGPYGPDPENPDLAAAADPSTGTIALAYQSADRRMFSDGTRTLIGSRVSVARITASGDLSFVVAPGYTERVSDIGLIVLPGETIVSYRPIDEATLTFDEAAIARHRGGLWEAPLSLGRATADPVTYASDRPELAVRLADGRIHLRLL